MTSVSMLSPSFWTLPLKIMVGSFSEQRGVNDFAGHRGGRSDVRVAQVNLRTGVAAASLEVTVDGGEGHLTIVQRAVVAAEAGAAGGCADRSAGLNKGFDQALGHRLQVDL